MKNNNCRNCANRLNCNVWNHLKACPAAYQDIVMPEGCQSFKEEEKEKWTETIITVRKSADFRMPTTDIMPGFTSNLPDTVSLNFYELPTN